MCKGMLLTVVLAFSAIPVHAVEPARKLARPIIGAVEYVDLDDAGLIVKARIDTGAGLTSINAEIVDIRPPVDGKPERVVFRVVDKQATKKTLVRDVVEWVNIKKKGGTGFIKRPVVRLDFCLGGKRIEARANLADREDFLYPVLIGRNVLVTGNFLVDPKRTFMHDPGCD
jgi:hypothetical protein